MNDCDCEACGRSLVRIEYAQAWHCPECLAKERDTLIAENERLRRALAPFVRYLPEMVNVDGIVPDHLHTRSMYNDSLELVPDPKSPTVGDYRRAWEAMGDV